MVMNSFSIDCGCVINNVEFADDKPTKQKINDDELQQAIKEYDYLDWK